jgi:hypothetical protein
MQAQWTSGLSRFDWDQSANQIADSPDVYGDLMQDGILSRASPEKGRAHVPELI